MTSRQESRDLLNEYVKTPSLQKHCLAVAAAMQAYTEKNDIPEEERDKWYICGLLHDFDFEKFPTLEQHGLEGSKILKEKGYDKELVQAVLAHNYNLNIPRETPLAKTLFAVDELCGLIVALAHVRPNHFEGMTPKSVKKAMKKKEFAKAINREEIKQGMEELQVNPDEHFELVIKALQGISKDLGF